MPGDTCRKLDPEQRPRPVDLEHCQAAFPFAGGQPIGALEATCENSAQIAIELRKTGPDRMEVVRRYHDDLEVGRGEDVRRPRLPREQRDLTQRLAGADLGYPVLDTVRLDDHDLGETRRDHVELPRQVARRDHDTARREGAALEPRNRLCNVRVGHVAEEDEMRISSQRTAIIAHPHGRGQAGTGSLVETLADGRAASCAIRRYPSRGVRTAARVAPGTMRGESRLEQSPGCAPRRVQAALG